MSDTGNSVEAPYAGPLDATAAELNKARAYIVTVGSARPGQSDLVPAVVNDVRLLEPEQVVLVCTPFSRSTADRLAEALAEVKTTVRIEEFQDAYDLGSLFVGINRIIQSLNAQGIAAPTIAINYTSGTKVMAASAVLSGIDNNCEVLRYLIATKQPGISRPLLTSPSAAMATRDINLAHNLALELRFLSAGEILAEVDPSFLSEPERAVVRHTQVVLAGYNAWDNFFYEAARDKFREAADMQMGDHTSPLVDEWTVMLPTAENVKGLDRLVDAVSRSRFTEDLLADLYNNAFRRLRDNKTSDAVSRGYRLLEMLAQQKLKSVYNIDTDNVDARRVPPRHRSQFEAMRSGSDGLIRVGLRKAYTLLTVLDDPLGAAFQQNQVLQQYLSTRYNNILAHGVRPMDRDEAGNFIVELMTITAGEFPQFPQLCQALQFPWLKLE